MKLISMTDFVLTKDSTCIFKYANFLKQPLELWMFIPCNDNGVVLEEPKTDFKYLKGSVGYDEVKEYNQAKDRVLFEGFEYNNGYLIKGMNCLNVKIHNTIEDLVQYSPILTQSAIKQIGL